MSYQTDKSFAYYHQGKIVEIYRITSSINGQIATLAGHKMVVPNSSNTSGIEYPDEDIINGIRFEYTSLEEPFVLEEAETTSIQYSASTISFLGNNLDDRDSSGSSIGAFTFSSGDRIRIQGSQLNDGYYTLTGASANTLSYSTANFVTEAKGELISITQVPKSVSSPTELSHINLNRLLSLAIVDYLKASFAEREGDLERKEYYMKQFSKKVSDNESNKNKIYMIQSTSFAVK